MDKSKIEVGKTVYVGARRIKGERVSIKKPSSKTVPAKQEPAKEG